jgi:hypothetical protein
MILDKLADFCGSGQAVSAAAYSTDKMDFGLTSPVRRIGNGQGLSIIIVVTVAAAGDSGSMTDTFDFLAVESVNADLSSHSTMIQRRIAGSLLVAGAVFEIPIPADRPRTGRYVGVRFEPGTGDTVTVKAYMVERDQVQAWLAYAKGYAV